MDSHIIETAAHESKADSLMTEKQTTKKIIVLMFSSPACTADSLTLVPLGPTGPTGPESPFKPWGQKIYNTSFLHFSF